MSQVQCNVVNLREVAKLALDHSELKSYEFMEIMQFSNTADTSGDSVVNQGEMDTYFAANTMHDNAKQFIKDVLQGSTCKPPVMYIGKE